SREARALTTDASKTSYLVLERTKLIIKHKKPVNTEDLAGRTRANNITAVYVENSEGERFKYPFIHIAGAKAMQRHVANGGRPYDDMGKALIGMSEQIAQLTAFKRHIGRHDGMNQEVNEIANRADMKLESLRNQMYSLSGQKAYESWCETFQPTSMPSNLDQATMENYKSKFTISSFKEDLAQYFPLIHSIMQEAGTINLEDLVSEASHTVHCSQCGGEFKNSNSNGFSHCKDHKGMKNYDVDENIVNDQFSKFEAWADAVTEGTLEPDALVNLAELLEDPNLIIGSDGDAGIESLEGIGIVNDALEKLIVARAAEPNGAQTPLKDVVSEWLYKDDPEAAQELGLVPAQALQQPDQKSATEPVAEAPEDRTSYKVARWLFDKGVRYDVNNEKHIIGLMDDAMKKLGMNFKEIRYHLSYDEDFIPDVLSDLKYMESALDEIAEGAEEDQVINKMDKRLPEGNLIKKVAEMVMSFYNRNHKEQGLGPFPQGEEKVCIHIRKELGDQAGELAEKFVARLSGQNEGSIQGGVWTSSPPAKGQPYVPVPQNIDGGSVRPAPKAPTSTPTPKPTPATPPMGTIKGGVWTADPPKPGEKGVPVPSPIDEIKLEEEFFRIIKLSGLVN
ncbi:MAG: hypothetical protein ACO3EE_11350, partial [Flavobacteriales bacterium]